MGSRGLGRGDLSRQPSVESFRALFPLRTRAGFGDRNEPIGEQDRVADECHAIKAQEGISRREPGGASVTFLECLRRTLAKET